MLIHFFYLLGFFFDIIINCSKYYKTTLKSKSFWR